MGCGSSKPRVARGLEKDLFAAAENGQLAEVKALLARGVAADLADDRGRTPLYIAAQGGRTISPHSMLCIEEKDTPSRHVSRTICSACASARVVALEGHPEASRKLPGGSRAHHLRRWGPGVSCQKCSDN